MIHSFRNNIYLLLILFGAVLLLWFINYSSNQSIRKSEQLYAHLVELDSQFSRLIASEADSIGDRENFSLLLSLQDELMGQCQECHSKKTDLLDKRRALIVRRHDVATRITKLRQETRQRLAELVACVSFIHEYHITVLKNLLLENHLLGDHEAVDKSWQRKPMEAVPEPDIICEAVVIQHRLADITNDFYELATARDPLRVHKKFKRHTSEFYQAVNTFESYSLDAQDGLLVEELLDNGRILESLFLKLIDLETDDRQQAQQSRTNRTTFTRAFAAVEVKSRNLNKRIAKRIKIVNLVSLCLVAFIVVFLLVRIRNIIHSIDSLVSETKKITNDVTYQIPLYDNTLSEFQVLQDTLNTMAAKLNRQIQTLTREIEVRLKMEEQLCQAKDEWERTFDAVPDIIFILDLNYRILRANQAMLDMFGVSQQKITGQLCCHVVHHTSTFPPYCSKMRQELDVESCRSDSLQQCNFFEKRLDRYFHVTMSSLNDNEGIQIGYVHVMRDVTEQRTIEQHRLLMEQKLQKSEKMEAIGMMAGGVAHDLNNILSGIINYPELMLIQMGEENEWTSTLELIRDSGIRAAAVVSDLLTIARGVASVRERHSINDLVREYLATADFMKFADRYPDVLVETQLAENLASCKCSAIHIQKLLMNLIINGAEAISGQGKVCIRTANIYIDEENHYSSELATGHYISIEVSDTGSGIPKKDQPHIFEPFYSKKSMGHSGTGLGLAVAWNAVHDHEGIILFNSSPKGTTFTVFLPSCAKTGEAASAHPADSEEEPFQGSGKVLVVDDDPLQRDVACRMLKILGYEPYSAASGEEAVTYIQQHDVDLILLDMIMEPGMNGRETLEEILKINPDQKALITSGYAENKEVKKACTLGRTALLPKPYTVQQFGKCIKQILDIR
jgi:PAS domain S-box-containing protein